MEYYEETFGDRLSDELEYYCEALELADTSEEYDKMMYVTTVLKRVEDIYQCHRDLKENDIVWYIIKYLDGIKDIIKNTRRINTYMADMYDLAVNEVEDIMLQYF